MSIGKRAMNSVLKFIGGKKMLRKSINEIVVNAEPEMLKGFLGKSEFYKNVASPNGYYTGLIYVIKPQIYTHPETSEKRAFMAVFLVPCRQTGPGTFEHGEALEAFTIDKFFDNLLSPYLDEVEKDKTIK